MCNSLFNVHLLRWWQWQCSGVYIINFTHYVFTHTHIESLRWMGHININWIEYLFEEEIVCVCALLFGVIFPFVFRLWFLFYSRVDGVLVKAFTFLSVFFLSFNSSTKTSIFQFQSPPSWLQTAVAATATTRAEAIAIDSYCALYIVFLCCEFFEWFCNHIAVVEGVFFGIGNSPENSESKSNSQKLSVKLFKIHTKTKISSCAVLFYSTYQHISFVFLAIAAVKRSTQNVRFIQLVVQIAIIRLLIWFLMITKKSVCVCVFYSPIFSIGRTWCKYLLKIGRTFTKIFRSFTLFPPRAVWLKCYKDCFRSTPLYCYRRARHHRSTTSNLQARAIAHSIPAFIIFLGSVPTVPNFRYFY